MALVRYSTWLPDGRTLAIVPGPGETRYLLDEQEIDKATAVLAWDSQPTDWQRGRTLDEAVRIWRGRL